MESGGGRGMGQPSVNQPLVPGGAEEWGARPQRQDSTRHRPAMGPASSSLQSIVSSQLLPTTLPRVLTCHLVLNLVVSPPCRGQDAAQMWALGTPGAAQAGSASDTAYLLPAVNSDPIQGSNPPIFGLLAANSSPPRTVRWHETPLLMPEPYFNCRLGESEVARSRERVVVRKPQRSWLPLSKPLLSKRLTAASWSRMMTVIRNPRPREGQPLA